MVNLVRNNLVLLKALLALVICLNIYLVNCDIPSTIGEGQCIWYDRCEKNPDRPHALYAWLNCKYDGPAKKLAKSDVIKLKEICPHLVEEIQEEDGTVKTCCSGNQIDITTTQLNQLGAFISNCPACYSNLKKDFCYFACHPRHSAFLNPTVLHNFTTETGEEKTSIWSVEQYMGYDYLNSAYNSCENVYYPAIGAPAFQVMCGPWGAENCSPERLFDHFGNNFMSPFNVTYVYGNQNTTAKNISDNKPIEVQPLNVKTIPCNTSDPDMRCVCQDCETSCRGPPQPEPPKDTIEVGAISFYVFFILMMYCLFGVAFVLFAYSKGLPGRFKVESRFCTFNHRISAKFEENLQTTFRKLAEVVAFHPYVILTVGVIAITVLTSGITMLKMTTDPVKLWASPESRTRHEKDYFDKNFGPFYRTNQIIITSIGIEPFTEMFILGSGNYTYNFGPVFNSTFMMQVMDFQLQIMNLTVEYDGRNITMNDICTKPMEPINNECLIQSVMNYWQNDPEKMMVAMVTEEGEESLEYTKHLVKCFSNPTYISDTENCLGTYGGPVLPYVALGGFLEPGQTIADVPSYEHSTALIITILGQNYIDPDKLGPALAWEKVLIDFLKNYSNPNMDFAFYSERGIEDEIIRESQGDIMTILISYLVMFTYVTISLGQPSSECGRIFIETKMTLGLCSVVLVFLSVIASIGLCSFLGVEGTLFVIEVIPFLVLAIGVDNIYLLVQTWQREERLPNESIEAHVARSVGKVAPSLLLATSSEAICFFLGALSNMPAVHAFAVFAGVAVSIGFILQITCLVALIVLDARRMKEDRYDVLCCFSGPKESSKGMKNKNICLSFFEQIYTPFIFKDIVRTIVVLIFVGCFSLSCVFVPHIDIGLEQDIGFPSDSFLIKYFDFLGEYLSVGSPVYFVMEEGFNFTDTEEQNLLCQSKYCNPDSILAQVFWASRSPDVTYIASGTNDWLDDYFSWISDGTKIGNYKKVACCRLDRNGNFINSSAELEEDTKRTCLKRKEFVPKTNRPLPEYFMEYLPYFLIDNPHGTSCPQAGHPSYGSAVVIKEEDCDGEATCVGASNFMAYHSILKTSKEFTDSLEQVYKFTDQMNEYLKNNSKSANAKIFPYSIFYVYYEQYLTMWAMAAKSLGISLLTVFLVMNALSGFDLWSSTINLIIIIMTIIDIMAAMVIWQIQLNAISLVNLVMAIGISVEFCSHITHSFAMTSGTRIERASRALAYTGSSVLSGITMTKFGGIIVLAFATSNVIIVFYFRMYLLIVLFGSSHGLIFLPVLLSLCGPPTNSYIQSDSKANDEPIPQKYVNHSFKE